MSITPADFDQTPVNRWLGMRLMERHDAGARVELTVRKDMLQEDRVVHGGVITALADTAAVYVLYPELPDEQGLTSIAFKVNFLRPALLDQGKLEARATLVKRGRTVSLCDVEVFQGERMLAKGLFTYMVFDRKRD